MAKVSQAVKRRALEMRSRVVSSEKTGRFETFKVEVETGPETARTVTVMRSSDAVPASMAASYHVPSADNITNQAAAIAALDCVSRHVGERGKI